MSRDALRQAGLLLHAQRWAALATLDETGLPHASMVAYVPASGHLWLHVSRLAAHTAHLLRSPQAALVISEPDPGEGDPQLLTRLSLGVRAEPLERASGPYAEGRSAYLARLPKAEPLFDFPDFVLFRLTPVDGRFVGGFARAFSFGAEELTGIC